MKKIKQEAFFMEDSEQYLALGTTSERRARQLIHKYEREECGVDNSELYQEELKPVKIVITKDEDGEDYYDWSGETECPKCKRIYDMVVDGFVGGI